MKMFRAISQMFKGFKGFNQTIPQGKYRILSFEPEDGNRCHIVKDYDDLATASKTTDDYNKKNMETGKFFRVYNDQGILVRDENAVKSTANEHSVLEAAT